MRAIHSSAITALVTQDPNQQLRVSHQGYLITASTAKEFTDNFSTFVDDPSWNPFARFLIVIRRVHENELDQVFDVLLRWHVNNVILVNGTNDAQLYSYNPFDNYGCGKIYKDVIRHGFCLETTSNLYPNKVVTGLRNCTLRAAIPHRPPFTLRPYMIEQNDRMKMGSEQYLFCLLAETEQFKVEFYYEGDYYPLSKLYDNISIPGPMENLRNNKYDVMFGSVMLVASREARFTYLHGHLDYHDEIRFIVKKANDAANWKNAYFEFHARVWWTLLAVFIVHSTLLNIHLRSKDKTDTMLKMFDLLLSHGCKMPHRMSARCLFLIWVWFAFLINNLYQSALVSLVRTPVKEYQVQDEEDIVRMQLKPCISPPLLQYMYTESNITNSFNSNCTNPFSSINFVAKSKHYYSVVQKTVYFYNKKQFCDEEGENTVYFFKKPYAKLIFGIFFHKGFPISDRMRTNAIRLRENGFVKKILKDHVFAREIKIKYHDKGFKCRITVPWFIYVGGGSLAVIVLILEIIWSRYKE
ncbi:uncharacterized protein LOC124629701 [Helicoverpa zea]|uniref:uncharacterized protein LOC124629701 n=1 Tax=Helicoverpa zea TaxID=7113 RepID=UPI001F55E91D|nr:uncharacterized protein LOC124629701 [Helicoverpa zea]